MTQPEGSADPERALALRYAPRACRGALAALWAVDERLGAIVASTSEPVIGEMRLLWWREALEALPGGVAGEPLLDAAERDILPAGVNGAEIGAMAEGWHALLGGPLADTDRARYAGERGGRLFALSVRILGHEAAADFVRAGEGWALADLARRTRDPNERAEALAMARERLTGAPRRWPRALRPLGALTMLARRDAAAGAPGRAGSPRRVARMARHRLTGR